MIDIEFIDRVNQVREIMNARGWSLALAESCTGGLISACITSQAGVSSFYKGSVVSYAGDVKKNVLCVPAELLQKWGEVSEPVAKKMALGVKQTLKSHWSLAVTGIAGPTGGTKEKPVGTVCFCVVGPQLVKTKTQIFPSGGRKDIQQKTVQYGLDLLIHYLDQFD